MIYLDNAATSFIKPPAVYRAVSRAMMSASNPGRGSHMTAMAAADLVYRCRERAAELFHMDDPSRVVFTSNATHALNIAVSSLVRPGCRALVSGFEHNAVVRPLHAKGAELRVAGRRVFDAPDTLRDVERMLPGCDLAVFTHISNVFGYVLPIYEIASLCRRYGVPLVVDASQSAGVLDVDMSALGAAFIAMPGHKALFGPQGTGLLLCGGEAKPLLYGGTGTDSASPDMPESLPERLEAGTLNVPGIAGLSEGLSYILERGTDSIRMHEAELLKRLVDGLSGLPRLLLFVDPKGEQSGILSFCVDGIDSESFCEMLSSRGVAVRGGLHCAPCAHRSAGTDRAGTVRISLSPFVSKDQIDQTCRVIRELI